jgi:ATP-binding cassette subfamily C protein CydCD
VRPFDPAVLRALPSTRGPVALLSLVGVLAGAVSIAQALVLAVAVGRVVDGGDLVAPLRWLVALLVLRGLLSGLAEVVARRAGLRVAGEVRLAVLRAWLGRPEDERPPTEVALARATEGISSVEPYVSRYLPALVTGAVVPALAVAALLVVDPWSALVVVLTLPLLPVFAALIGRHTQEQTQRRWGAMAQLAGHFLDVVRGLPTLVVYGRARAQVAVVREVGERHRLATVRTLRTAFLSTAALELLATISVAMVAVGVGLRLAHGSMDLVVGLTAILLAPEAYWPVRRVGAEFHTAADGAAVLEELRRDGTLATTAPLPAPLPTGRAVWRSPGRPDARYGAPQADRTRGVAGPGGGGPGAGPGRAPGGQRSARVLLTHVSYAHPGRERTVTDVTLSTAGGPGLTTLTGPSGAGKTTVLELLAGLRTPAAGEVEAPDAHLASQRPVILPGSVRDNLALVGGRGGGGRPGDAAMVTALERVGLWEALRLREGLDTVLGDDGFGLSAGQRARLALARALLADAPLVLLDEPTANVAASSVPALHGVITELARERRVVVVTHDPALEALADERWRLAIPAPETAYPARVPDRGAGTTRHKRRADDGCDASSAHRGGPAGVVRALPTPAGRRGLALACLLGGLAVSSGVALTATSGWLIVQASTMPVILTLMVAIVGVRAFGLARPVFRYAERVVSHDVALEELAERRADVFARLVPLTPARLGRRSRGEVLSAVVRDLDDVVDERVRVVVPGWSAVLATLVGAAVAGWHLPQAGLVVAAAGVLVLSIGAGGYAAERAAQARAVAARGRVQHAVTALTSRLLQVQAVTGLHADRTPLLRPVADAEADQRRAEQRLVGARAVGITLTWLVVAATTAAVAVLAWRAQSAGVLDGPYAALVTLVPVALADTWVEVPTIAGARARARAASARLQVVLAQEPAVAARGSLAPGRGPHHLTLEQVGARWPSARGETERGVDLEPLDLDLPPGARVTLTGPNGVGKSTALALVARHLDPLCGRAALDADDVLALDLDETRARMAVVDDEPHAFAGSVRANLALAAPDASDDDMVTALHAVDLGHWFATLPQGLDTLLTGLSGGERARLSMARALLSGRPVVLLDEPTAHLDDATAGRALAGLLGAAGGAGTTYLLVSHRAADLDPQTWECVELGREPVALTV